MQVEIKKNIYMQQTSPDEISMVYVMDVVTAVKQVTNRNALFLVFNDLV